MSERHDIIVFGEALIDDFGSAQVVGGAPFNVARNLAALGASPLMVTRIGADRHGALVEAEFTRFGLSIAGLQCDDALPTGQVAVVPGADGHRFEIARDQAYDAIEAPPALTAQDAHSPAMTYFGTLALRAECSRASANALLGANPASRFLDLNLRAGHYERKVVEHALHLAHCLKVNENELDVLLTWCGPVRLQAGEIDSAAGRQACAALMAQFGLTELIVTLGPDGVRYMDAAGAWLAQACPAHGLKHADTVGAGDAFASVFLLGRLRNWSVQATLARANAFAGAVCELTGAVAPELDFYHRWRRAWDDGTVAPTSSLRNGSLTASANSRVSNDA